MADLIKSILIMVGVLSLPAAWITHVVVCLSAAKWGFLIAGAILFPVAVVHGYGIWLGLF